MSETRFIGRFYSWRGNGPTFGADLTVSDIGDLIIQRENEKTPLKIQTLTKQVEIAVALLKTVRTSELTSNPDLRRIAKIALSLPLPPPVKLEACEPGNAS